MDDDLPSAAGPVALLVTGTTTLADDVRELAAVTGVTLRHVVRARDAGPAWHRSALVLLGDDAAAAPLPEGRRDVVLLTRTGGPDAWRAAAAVGADRVVVLPDARAHLVELLAGLGGAGRRRGTVAGVVGGRGGAGASTFALGLGLEAVWGGTSAVLVDADPLGGGVDVLAGVEHSPGLRWPDLAGVRGLLRPDVLGDGLPTADGLALLSFDRSAQETAGVLDPDVARRVVAAAAAGHELVVVDLPRGAGPAETAVWRLLDVVVLVVPAELRAALGAVRLAEQVRQVVPDVRLVVRPAGRGGGSVVPVDLVAEVLDLPLAATWPLDPRLPAAADRSDLVAALWHRRTRRAAAAVLDALLGPVAGPGRADAIASSTARERVS